MKSSEIINTLDSDIHNDVKYTDNLQSRNFTGIYITWYNVIDNLSQLPQK